MDKYKILLNKSSSTLAPAFMKGEFAGQTLTLDEEMGGYVIEVDKGTAIDFFNSSFRSSITLIGPELTIYNRFTNQVVEVIKPKDSPADKSVKVLDDGLDSKSLEELRDMAKELGLKGMHNAHKDTLLEKIRSELGTEE